MDKSLNELQIERMNAREYTPEDLKKMAVLQDEVEKVYNFERDVATAKVMDPTFEATVDKIAKTMDDVKRTYKDQEYLRDPLKPEASAARRAEDRSRARFEATKQALDQQRTKYIIK